MTNKTPVLIVGGGGAGLTCSMLLSTLGVEHILVSSLPGTSILPKAHVLNQRTMEILGDVGVAEQIYAKSTPAENMRYMGWYAGFTGEDPDFGRLISKVESWGCGYENLNWLQASSCRSANLPQIRLEPLMKARAEKLNPGKVRFHHELIGLEQDDDGATAQIKNNDTGEEYTVRSRYVLGCDGGRTIPKMVGIDIEGLGVLFQTATAHVSADLSKLAPDPDVLIRWIWCPAISELAVLVPMGPDHWGPDSEEWVFHVSYQGEGPKTSDGQADRREHARCARHRRHADEGPQDHALGGGGGAGEEVPRGTGLPGRRRGASPSAHGGPGPDERNTGLTKYLLEDRGRSQGAGERDAARQLRGGASPRGRAQHPALDGEFDGASRSGTCVRIEPRRQAGRQLGAIEADLERQARGRRASWRSVARDPANQHGSERAERGIRLSLFFDGRRSRRVARAPANRGCPPLRAEHASG